MYIKVGDEISVPLPVTFRMGCPSEIPLYCEIDEVLETHPMANCYTKDGTEVYVGPISVGVPVI